MKKQVKKMRPIVLVITTLFAAATTGAWIYYLRLGLECGRNERLIAMVIAWAALVWCVDEILSQTNTKGKTQTLCDFWKEVRGILIFLGKLFLLLSIIGVIVMLIIWLTKPGMTVFCITMGVLLILILIVNVFPFTTKLDIYLTKFLRERGFIDWLFGSMDK